MSQLPLRKETNCLNCGTEVHGRYCHVCGQQNTELKETFWGLVTHFFQDLTHWDGKFFSTLKYVLFKPGFLTKEYVNGRRVSFLHPVKMYVFTSAVFFIIFFSIFQAEQSVNMGMSDAQIDKLDSTELATLYIKLNDGKPLTRQELKKRMNRNGIQMTETAYPSKEAYDSVLRSGKVKHGWVQKQLVYKEIALNKKYNNDAKVIATAIIDKFLHILPQMMFVLLPLFALGLKLLYIRRKRFYYVDHIIFSLHLYVFVFMAMLIIFFIGKMYTWLDWQFLRWLSLLVTLSIFFYLYKAMRNFYQQRRAKTVVKYFILLLYFLVITLTLFTLFFLFSFLQL